MHTIYVKLGNRSYPIWIEPKSRRKLPELLKDMNHGQKWVIITQDYLGKKYADQIINDLKMNGFSTMKIIIPSGEEAKSLAQVEKIYTLMIEAECDRSTTLLALGGGVVGDVTGFVAATFMRGVPYFQIPTTLLGMVDSSIGGKTGVNLKHGKNLIGAIYQPKGVVVDPEFLQTLPPSELVSGMAEVIKYGAILDQSFFIKLSKIVESGLNVKDVKTITQAIVTCAEIKSDLVSQDEREGDLRRLLNFGHTIGHALETTVGYEIIKHGEAVAYGMICAGYISANKGLLHRDDYNFMKSVILKLPLPDLPILDIDKILHTVKHDKKVKSGKLHFVLLKGIGHAVISDEVSNVDIFESLGEL